VGLGTWFFDLAVWNVAGSSTVAIDVPPTCISCSFSVGRRVPSQRLSAERSLRCNLHEIL
jgi:hypothetical protein